MPVHHAHIMHATIKDIARVALVSVNTVSRALNNKPDVNKRTKRRILSIAKQLNYSPNYLAKGLISRQTRTIGVVVTDNANPFFAKMIKGIEDVAYAKGYNIILCNTDEDPVREENAIRLLYEKRVDGILITPVQTGREHISKLMRLQIPFVLLNRHSNTIETDYIINDNAHGAKLAINRLLEIGRRRIVYIAGPASVSSVQERLEGCRMAMRQGNVSLRNLHIEHTNLKLQDGYDVMIRILRSASLPLGVFTYDDLLAIGAMKAIGEAGFKIPDDVALVGYDDIDFAEFLEVPLTTVRQQRYRIGEMGAKLLVDRMGGKTSRRYKHVVLRPDLIIRKSA